MKIQENSTLVILPESELQLWRRELSEIKTLFQNRQEESERIKWLPKKDAAHRLDVSTKTLDSYFKRGVLSFTQFKGKIYVKSEDIEAHLNKYYVSRVK